MKLSGTVNLISEHNQNGYRNGAFNCLDNNNDRTLFVRI